jgi:beta-glucosidase
MSEITTHPASLHATANATTIAAEQSPASVADVADPPRPFYWGAATAAYQIEGSPQADGAGRCVWDEFSRTPDAVFAGDTGDLACDHYHRWPQDVELMRELGLGAYRFSIRWPRILPEGVGSVNQKGLAFYDRLVDGLLEAGIEPFPTLFHWDMPAALQRRGGWSNRDVASWFAEYTIAVTNVLGDRIKRWTTFNEPFVVAEQGHLVGVHAPGIRNVYATCSAIHNQLRAHVAAVRVIKANIADAEVGIVLHNAAAFPASSSPEDVLAAEVAHQWHNYPLFADPLVHGRYPLELEQLLRPYMPDGYEDDMPGLQHRPDFLGMNYYSGYRAQRDAQRWLGFSARPEPEMPRTAMDWIIRPEGLHAVLKRAHEDYNLPSIYVTENGAAFDDVRHGSTVEDDDRIAYLDGHIRAVLQARDEGVPVHGYFVWSLFDNFEWACGYEKRFGIVYIDFETQERIVKQSGHFYSRLAREGRAALS